MSQEITEKEIKKMYVAARGTLKHTNYYKNKAIAAAIITNSGKIYTGVCYQIYQHSVCAEKVALVKALSEGDSDVKAVLITSKRDSHIWPCGYCRKDLYKLLGDRTDLTIISCPVKRKLNYQIKNLKELYPFPN